VQIFGTGRIAKKVSAVNEKRVQRNVFPLENVPVLSNKISGGLRKYI